MVKKLLFKIFLLLFIAVTLVQCNLIRSETNETAEIFDPNILMNSIQLNSRNINISASRLGGELTRMRVMFGDTYGSAYSPNTFNPIYEITYSQLFSDIRNLRMSAELQNLDGHEAVTNVLKAYTLITLVDLFNDMPFEEAIAGLDILSPALDSAETIYDNAINLLNQAITLFELESTQMIPNDLYFGHLNNEDLQKEAWIRTANTIKLKAYLNTGNSSAINDLFDEGRIILNPDENFVFFYSTTGGAVESRHPMYANNYESFANDYMSNSFINMLLNDKEEIDKDPRIRYYFYRQSLDEPEFTLKSCINSQPPSHFSNSDPFCHLEDGYWGRDHLISGGIPPDNELRTVPGVYPAGGLFDMGQAEAANNSMGYRGAGFQPFIISSFTHFMLAEHHLTLTGNQAEARNHFETAIRQAFEIVRDFGADQASGQPGEITDEKIDEYLAIVLDRWDNSEEQRLRNLSKEYYLALWPNGYEAYNLVRRTGYPNRMDNMQPARTSAPGDWYRSFLYPQTMVVRNANVQQKTSRLSRVFWDTRGEDDEFNY